MSAIELKDIWKRYLLEYRCRHSIKDVFLNFYKRNHRQREFWALKGIDLSIPKGEAVGIIGRNGSGKTTLLKLISGITNPTKGFLNVNGRVASILELGAGFQSDLNGRENIYLNGSILGLSRNYILKNIDSIIDFADIGDFIDAPVRTYSAGMYLRLGFSIAVQLDPDILLIDEVLAVGDEAFQEKCLSKIRDFKKMDKTIVLVSHNLNVVRRLCERVILIDGGSVVCEGSSDTVINRYMSLLGGKGRVWPTKEIEIRNVYFKNNKGEIVHTFMTGEEMTIIIEYHANKKISNPVFGLSVYRDNAYLLGPNTRDDNYGIDYVEGRGILKYVIGRIPFSEGNYRINASIHTVDETCLYDYHECVSNLQVILGKKKFNGLVTIEDAVWENQSH